MKKILLLLLIGTLFSCSTSEDSDVQSSVDLDNAGPPLNVQRIYIYNGKQYILDFIVNGNEIKAVKDQIHFDLFSKLLQNSNTIVYPVNSGQYHLIFENEDEFQYYLENPNKLNEAPILPPEDGGGGGGGNPSDPNGNVSLFEHNNFGGKEVKTSSSIHDLTQYSMNDRITSIKINSDVAKVILYEDAFYSGNRIEITGPISISCLCDYRINRSSVIYVPVTEEHPWNPDDWCGGGFTFGCNSWNDEISSIKIIYN